MSSAPGQVAERSVARPERVVGDLLRAHASAAPEHRFLICGRSEFSFAALDARTDAVAAGLSVAGVGKGDRVAIVCSNRVEMVELFFAVAKLGAIQVPLNAYLKGEFLRYQLADSLASALVVDASAHAAVAPMLAELPELRLLVLLDDSASESGAPHVAVHRYAEMATASERPPIVEVAPADLMSIVYTSGTTGQPKGCMLSHGYYTRVAKVMGDVCEFRVDDVLITALPLFHGAARMMILTAGLAHGLPVVIESEFRASMFLARATEVGATLAFGVGAMGAALLGGAPSEQDRAHPLRMILLIPFPAQRQEQFAQRFGVEVLAELFGQTECLPVTCSPLSGPRNPASCGVPAEDLEVALLDDEVICPGNFGQRKLDFYAAVAGRW